MTGIIRIIGGQWRGRKLPVLDSEGLRPTTDRLKETLFNWLMPVIIGADCLDCYSGSGSLGFESLSRGANSAILLEKSNKITTQLKKNKAILSAQNCEVITTDTLSWLKKPANKQFDVIFIDPPFNQQLADKTIAYLEENSWLKQNCFIYVETEPHCELSSLPSNWLLHREKLTSQIHLRLYKREI